MINNIVYSETRSITRSQILRLYEDNEWSSARKPEQLCGALANSHSLVSAWDENTLVGLGNAISDGHLVVYYPHLLVLSDYQRRGIGMQIMQRLCARYEDFHQHMLVADRNAIDFYRKCGFERAWQTEPMWIYDGAEH